MAALRVFDMTVSAPLDLKRLARTLHETLILDALRAGPVHGYWIARDIEERTGGFIAIGHGTLYPLLHHLEKQGWITGSWPEGRGPRRRKVYVLTAGGWAYLEERAVELRALQGCLVPLLSNGRRSRP